MASQKYFWFHDNNFEYGEYLNGSTTYINSSYEIKKNRIYIDNNNEPWFDFQIKNSGEMRYINPNDMVFIYKRINDSLMYDGPKKLNLIGKSFQVSKAKEIIDTAHFMNDSVVTWSSRLKNTGADKWIVHDIAGYKLLSIQWFCQSSIYEVNNNALFLKCFAKEPFDIVLKEID